MSANPTLALGTLVINVWPMRLGYLAADVLLLLNALRRR